MSSFHIGLFGFDIALSQNSLIQSIDQGAFGVLPYSFLFKA